MNQRTKGILAANFLLATMATAQQPQPKPAADIQVVLGQAKAAALQIKDNFQRGLVLDEIGAAEAKAGDLDSAVETANRAYPHTMSTLTAIGNQLYASGDPIKVRAIGPKLQGGGASTMFFVIASRQAENGKIEDALRTVQQIAVPEVRSDALRVIAQQQIARGDYSGAHNTLSGAKPAYPAGQSALDDISMMLAEAQTSRGETKTARETIAAMKLEDRPAAMIFASESLRKKGDLPAARALLDEGLRTLPAGQTSEFLRYFAIPTEVRLGLKQRAMLDAASLSPDMRVKGYAAVAVACAEDKDVLGVNAALEKMRSTEPARRGDFASMLMTLNVTAALIDAGAFEEATRLLAAIEKGLDGASRTGSQVQLQRVVALAQQSKFDEGRSLALRIRPDSVSDTERGTALRIVALLETKTKGLSSARLWASVLADAEDRSYALLGISQALLGIGEVHLPYSAIQIH
jgi:hypothetical protein